MKTERSVDFERETIAMLKEMLSSLQAIAKDYSNMLSKLGRIREDSSK